MQPIADYNVFFDSAKKALEESAAIRDSLREARQSKEGLEDELQKSQEELKASIDREISTKRGQISRTYDAELDGTREMLKEAQKARHMAKNKGVKERIAEETAQFHAENRNIQGKIMDDLRSRNLPDYCDGRLFNILYFPEGAGDHVLFFMIQLLCYIAIPTVIALISNTTNLWVVVGIFAADILIFNAAYFNVLRNVVYKNYDVLSEAVSRRAQIRDNAARIEEITDDIRNDPDEESYNLGGYDDEIGRIEQEMDKLELDKSEALAAFDSETRTSIADELTRDAQPRIDELTAGIEKAALEVAELESRSSQKNQELAQDYEPYLGRKFMTVKKIEALRDIINHGTAANITEAKEEYEKKMEG